MKILSLYLMRIATVTTTTLYSILIMIITSFMMILILTQSITIGELMLIDRLKNSPMLSIISIGRRAKVSYDGSLLQGTIGLIEPTLLVVGVWLGVP